MLKQLKVIVYLLFLLPALAAMQGCGGCGFNCDNAANGPSPTSVGLSGSANNDLKSVVLTVDAITFRRTNADDVVIDQFTIDEINADGDDTFQIDLLDYRGLSQLTVIKDTDFDRGNYNSIVLTLVDNDVNSSYVQEADDERKELNITGTTLTIDGMRINSRQQTITIKFSLAQALQYISSSDTYQLTTKGIRVLDNDDGAAITGRVDSDLLDQVADCRSNDQDTSNRVYLYSGRNLTVSQLADVYTSNSSTSIPANAIHPFDVALVRQNPSSTDWEYFLGFLPSGDYTLAFTCNAETDDSIDYDNISIPLPTDQLYEITLDDERVVCDLADGATCQ